MNGVSHYSLSVLVTLLVYHLIPKGDSSYRRALRILVILVCNTLLHSVVDSLSNFTYHPARAQWGDPVFTLWHVSIYAGEAVFAIYALRRDVRYAWGMVGSVVPDIWDWSFGRVMQKYFSIQLPRAHNFVDWVTSTFFFWTPNWREIPLAALCELVFISLCLLVWLRTGVESSLSPRTPSTSGQLLALILIFGSLRLMTFL